MSGYYPGTYSFESDDVNSNPNGFTVDEQGGQVNVIDDVGGHDKVVEVYDTSSAYEPELRNSFPIQTKGTVEFWMMSNDVNYATYFRLMDDQATSIYGAGIGRVTLDEDKVKYLDDAGWHDTSKTVYDNIWYHVKIEFECTSGNYLGLAQYTWRFYIDGEVFGDFGFEVNINNVSQAFFFTYWGDSNYRCYIDAIGYSWDPSYTIGSNLNEGLLLSYNSSTTLDWTGFSLDGQTNQTILGNITIPIQNDGLHTIQVYGNNSLGVMAESGIRYFTTNLMAPEISINLPIPNTITGTNPPEFDISILDTDLNTTWYSLDGGTTTIPFSGLIGTISQTEWDKIGNGTATITFYANDTVNNIGQAEVTIRKDIIAPVITITSPTSAEEFDYTPIFDITIDEANLDEFWYTIDNGATNYTITSLTGTINQIVWDAAPDGPVTIRFYARDDAGNIGTNSVIVAKIPSDLPPPPPGIPGYNLIALLGVTLAVTLILAKMKHKK